jgi:hypothetical protein
VTTYSSRLPAVIDALVGLCRAASGHRDPESTTITVGVPVFDGPEYGITGDRATAWLAIGWSGDPDQPEDGGDAEQVIAALGNRSRAEAGSIRCRACGQTGDRDMASARNAAFTEMAVVESICRNTPTLGLTQAWMMHAEIGDRYMYRQEYNAGAVFTLDFRVVFKARI